MESFKQKFIEEAIDLINELESTLLLLEENISDKSLIERVFRVMHSLKGSGAMFGFEKISDFTHELESVYDLVRSDEIYISKELLNITLESVDHLKQLLNEGDQLPQQISEKHQKLKTRITNLTHQLQYKEETEDPLPNAPHSKPENPDNNNARPIATYCIHFKPNADIFSNGTNPLFLIDELGTLGKIFACPYFENLPAFEAMQAINCYTTWDIVLATSEDINSIGDVFIFVEDECELRINQISTTDLLSNAQFNEALKIQCENYNGFSINDLNNILLEINAEKQPAVQNKTAEKAKPVSDTASSSGSKDNVISTIRVSSDKLDHLMNLVSELVTTQARLSLFAENKNDTELMAIAEDVAKLSRQLRDNAFDICLIPIENMLTRFKRLVRDLSAELNKTIEFVTEGTETELDKTIIEHLVDPIMHILRNSIDHGIEPAQQRRKAGKSETGKITLRAYYSGTSVNIEIQDDGAGIDAEIIYQKAIDKKLVSPDQNFTQQEKLNMVFMPGLSTAHTITGVSGRGVGMDVVKRKIDEVRGDVEIRSELTVGTTITVKLPLTLSIIDGLLVRIKETYFVIPLSVVGKIYEVEHQKIINTFNNIVVLDGRQYPFLYLREEFEMTENPPQREQIVLVKYADKEMGLAVDTVEGEYQAVLKPMGKHYRDLEIISGATILGDGTVALVMDTNKIIRQFVNDKLTEN